ncbi:hypothetical protein D9619_004615 [Psilocybe cf. subviscida]|uniref:Peptidase S9 prolyl oligopeptidase catalytic domain-containing protein n=1 Tax=Psilocybe cf. subviscida TaxID=2480587 RepID=A0A8H5F7Y5_9AGAR|nr:hypothetical protein D9619_004615 [Psilocybe cf. subviscida]
MSVQVQSLNIGGIRVQVFLPSKLSASVAVLFLLHGRHGSAKDVEQNAQELIEQVNGHGKKGKSLCIVTLNHRNHGERTVIAESNNAWSEEPANWRHALDMYSIQLGTTRDVSHLIDFLPAYLFPQNEHTIDAWGIAGISLGGHSTWLGLANDPRLELGIPIIGCPDYLKLIKQRAEGSGIAFAPPHIPDSFINFVKSVDPASTKYTAQDSSNPFYGKKVLVLSGEVDKLVPWTASQEFVDALEVGPGKKKVFVQKGVGHEATKEMLKEAGLFIQEELC